LLPVMEAVLAAQAEPPKQPESLRGTGLVLVVDDDRFVRSVAKNTLERYGYSVLVASNGKEGVELLRIQRDRIRLVLLDLMMPVMGGEDALREIRLIHPTVPVLLSSGFNEVEASRRFTGKGLAGFIQKPYTASMLAAKVKEVLGASSAAPE